MLVPVEPVAPLMSVRLSSHTVRPAVALAALVLPFSAAPRAAGAQPDALTPPPVPIVRVALELDSGVVASFEARDFDLRVAQAGAEHGATELRLVKQVGAHTGDLVRLGASGERAPSATIEILDSLGAPSATVRLRAVTVASDRIALSAARATLEQQRLSQQEALSALTTEYQEAERQRATVEALGKSHIGTRQDLERARDRASDLARRIELLRRRQALVERQLAAQGPLEETVVLRFDALEIDSGAPGGRAMVELTTRDDKRARGH
jgi:hypothetical protein